MTAWLAAVLALLPPLAATAYIGLSSDTAGRLVALQLGTAVSVLILVLMSFAFDQPSFVDLPLSLGLLSLPGTLVLAHFLERWL